MIASKYQLRPMSSPRPPYQARFSAIKPLAALARSLVARLHQAVIIGGISITTRELTAGLLKTICLYMLPPPGMAWLPGINLMRVRARPLLILPLPAIMEPKSAIRSELAARPA